MTHASASFAAALRLLGRVLVTSRPYSDQLIVIGGMAPVIYRRLPQFAKTSLAIAGTTEVDLSIPPRLRVAGRPLLELLGEAGLVVYESPGYRGAGGAQSFQDASFGTDRRAPTYVEFLAPNRGNSERTMLEVQPGLRAEALRYLDLLAFEPLVVDGAIALELEVQGRCPLRVPQPALYVAQKVLARRSGRLGMPAKAEKDLAYTYDVALLSQPAWNDQAGVVRRAAKESDQWGAWLARAGRDLRALFATRASDGPVAAGRIYRDLMEASAPSEDEIRKVVLEFAAAVFP